DSNRSLDVEDKRGGCGASYFSNDVLGRRKQGFVRKKKTDSYSLHRRGFALQIKITFASPIATNQRRPLALGFAITPFFFVLKSVILVSKISQLQGSSTPRIYRRIDAA
ncbi:unnamed protein product, partial [Dovyalis caffra]